MSTANPAIAAQTIKVSKTYHSDSATVEALRGVDLQIAAGSFIAVMGASGSGKSTLLHLLAGLDRPDVGTVQVAGQDLSLFNDRELTIFRRRHIGVVFQAFNLMPVLSARENVALPLILDDCKRSAAMERADEALTRVGLAARGDHRPDQLSGGEQQRVAFARALITNPDLILADEPTGNLDSVAATRIGVLLRQLHADQGRTVVIITHEAKLASFADAVVILADGQVCGTITGDRAHDPAQLSLAYLELASVGAVA
jgi:putative ABC transport system ATP-binding protein